MGALVSAQTKRALRLVAKGMTPHAAAIKCGISPSTVSRHVRKALYAAPVPENNSHDINELYSVNYRSSADEK